MMEKTAVILILIGFFLFIGFGLSAANSIEAHESERTKNVFCGISLGGLVSGIIGIILLIVSQFSS